MHGFEFIAVMAEATQKFHIDIVDMEMNRDILIFEEDYSNIGIFSPYILNYWYITANNGMEFAVFKDRNDSALFKKFLRRDYTVYSEDRTDQGLVYNGIKTHINTSLEPV